MSNLLNDFDWKDYGMKHGLDSDSKCVEHAIRESVIIDSKKPTVFDWKRYIKDHPDLQRALGKGRPVHVNDATCHYLSHGIKENRKKYILGTNEPYVYDFDWKMYDKLNPDVFTQRHRNVGEWHCFRHWCEYGYKEGRKTGLDKQVVVVVKTDASISTDEKVNKMWRRELSNLLNMQTYNTIEDIINDNASDKMNLQIVSTSVVCNKLFEKYYNIKSFVSKDTPDLVIIWNIDTKNNREIFDYRKKKQLPVLYIERGCLPNTVIIDDNESIYKTDRFKNEIWNKPLCEKEHELITGYIKNIRDNKTTLETQQIKNVNDINTKGFKHIIFCPLQRRQDTSITQYGGWVKSVDNFYLIMKQLSAKHKDILFLIKSHPMDMLTARYKDNSTNFKFVDDYHVNDILELCDKVILINSGVGIFSMMYNKPCGILGQSFYHIPGVNVKINNELDITKFIENKSITVNEEVALRYLYYLKYHYLNDAKQEKNDTTNNKTIFITNDILLNTKRIDLLYENVKLKINHVLFGPSCNVFDNILSKIKQYMTNYQHVVSSDFDETCDIFIIWRLRNNSPVEFKKQWLDIPKIRDNSYIYLHESIDSNKCIPNLSFDDRKPLFTLFNKFICTSMEQYNILKKNLSGNVQIYYSPLASINDIPKSPSTNNKITVGFVGYEYDNDLKNFQLFKDIISTLDRNLIKIKLITDINKSSIDNLIKMGFEVQVSNTVTDMDILIITSKSEGSPIPVYECLQNNVRCMSTNVGNISEILHPEYIYNTKEEGINVLNNIINNIDTIDTFKNRNYSWELTCNELTEILSNNIIYFKINDPSSNILHISFATINTKYSDSIDDLCDTLTKNGNNYYIAKIPDYNGWKNNTYIKASWIYDILQRFTYDIVWIDMDTHIIKTPLYSTIEKSIDVSIPYIEHWKLSDYEYISAVLYFKNNESSKKFLETWIKYNCKNYYINKFEQANMIDTYNELHTSINIDRDFFTFKELYNDLYRIKFPFSQPNIYQLQFSRVTQNVAYANMNKEYIKEKIIKQQLSAVYNNEIYIIGGGPSIDKFDTSILKNKFVVGINSAILNKDLDINYSAFCSLDYSFLTTWKNNIQEFSIKNPSTIKMFYQNMNKNGSIIPIIKDENLYYFNEKTQKTQKCILNGIDYCFSKNILKHMFTLNNKLSEYEPISSGAAAICIAAHMGFTNINLIGFDGNISNKSHSSTLYEDSNRTIENFKGHIFNRIDDFEENLLTLLKILEDVNVNFLTPTSYKISNNI